MRNARIDWALGAVLVVMAIGVSACGSSSSSTASSNLPTSIGAGEGQLNLVAWEGYAQPEWVKPFEKSTGCVVHAKYAGSSDEMVTLMRQGGGSQYDMVSASGDASLRLIRGGDVAEMNVNLVPEWKNFIPQLQSPPHNTVDGKHYGISLQWGPNILLYNSKTVSPAPTSWSSIYSPKYKGQITIPNNPIQIADVALYLSKTQPSLGITDPYELTEAQLNAAGKLLKEQKPLIKKYWALASDQIELFKSGDSSIGAAWPYQQSTLEADKVPVKSLIPVGGCDRVGGHLDALGSRQAPQLRLQMGELGLQAAGPGAAGDLLRRDAGQHQGLRLHGRNPEGLLRGLPRERAGRLLRLDQVLEDPRAGMRQRSDELHGLQRLAAEVDRSNRIAEGRG